MKLINIGFGNMVNASKLVTIVSNDSAPMKRIIQESKNAGTLIDATQGRKTRAVLIMDSNHVILSYLYPETIADRLSKDVVDYTEEEEDE